MNEYGLASIRHYGELFTWFFALSYLMPFFKLNDVQLILGNLTELQYTELLFWFMIPLVFLIFLRAAGMFVSSIFCVLIYLFQKSYVLHKLSKPERLYTGKEG